MSAQAYGEVRLQKLAIFPPYPPLVTRGAILKVHDAMNYVSQALLITDRLGML